MNSADPGAFDNAAPRYDRDFTHTRLGVLLRRRVWRVLADVFPLGANVLDLACGTGEDAVWLARRGLSVTAVDGSAAMVEEARKKALRADCAGRITVIHCALEALAGGSCARLDNTHFQGALSNFGGLNVLRERSPLARRLASWLAPGARLVLVPMGPVCPWETLWYGLNGDRERALRRRRQPAFATVGNVAIPVWYPSARRLRLDMEPWFRHLQTESLGLWLPPSYLAHLVDRFPHLFSALGWWERHTALLTGGCGDHYIAVFERTAADLPLER